MDADRSRKEPWDDDVVIVVDIPLARSRDERAIESFMFVEFLFLIFKIYDEFGFVAKE
jgi:hypothetical protein